MEVDLLCADTAPVDEMVANAKRLLQARHGSDDDAVVTQQALNSILGVLTAAVAGLGYLPGGRPDCRCAAGPGAVLPCYLSKHCERSETNP